MKSVAAASSSAGSSAASNRDTPTPPPAGDEDEGENGKIKRRGNRFRERNAEFTQPNQSNSFQDDKSQVTIHVCGRSLV